MGTGFRFQGANARQNQQQVAQRNQDAYADLFGSPQARLRWEPSLGRFVQTQWDKDPMYQDLVQGLGGTESPQMREVRQTAVNQRSAGNKWWQPWRDMYSGNLNKPAPGNMGFTPAKPNGFTSPMVPQMNGPSSWTNAQRSSPWHKGFQ